MRMVWRAATTAGARPTCSPSVEAATGKKLPPNFASGVSAETVRRFRTELRALPHVAHALTWVRGPKAVASSSPHDRLRAGLDAAGLLRFFEARLFSASDVPNGKPAPDLFRFAAGRLAGRSGVLHRGRGFGARRRRRGRGRNDGDRLCRRQSNAGPARPGPGQCRRPHRDRRHAGAQSHHHRHSRLVNRSVHRPSQGASVSLEGCMA